jgi:hypothetical protein
MPRLCSTAVCALRILLAATIFIALVILPMFLIALMRCFTVVAGVMIGDMCA